jgi:phage-related protein
MANEPQPYWPWCAMQGASRNSKLNVDVVEFGDGYKQRATRGLNPIRPEWALAFPFVGLDDLKAKDDFLRANSNRGFYFTPPDSTGFVFVTADAWSATIVDKNKKHGVVGQLTVTLVQAFNPQPMP